MDKYFYLYFWYESNNAQNCKNKIYKVFIHEIKPFFWWVFESHSPQHLIYSHMLHLEKIINRKETMIFIWTIVSLMLNGNIYWNFKSAFCFVASEIGCSVNDLMRSDTKISSRNLDKVKDKKFKFLTNSARTFDFRLVLSKIQCGKQIFCSQTLLTSEWITFVTFTLSLKTGSSQFIWKWFYEKLILG